jgi:hypothetical protein
MQSIRRPACPVCATDMAFGGVFSTTFWDGKLDHSIRFICAACRVEMTTAARNAPPMDYGVAPDGDGSGQTIRGV